MCVYMGYYVFPKSNDSAVAKSTVSISLQKKKKGSGILGEVAESRTTAGKIQDISGTSGDKK